MRLVLGLSAVIGMLVSFFLLLRLLEVASTPNGGLAVFAMLGPLGSALVFTAVCAAGARIVVELVKITRLLEASRADQLKAMENAMRGAAPSPVLPSDGHWVNPKYAPTGPPAAVASRQPGPRMREEPKL